MTLIISVSCREFYCMVSDRLISLVHPHRGFSGVHDAISNKNLLVRAINGEFAIGYTGSAYVGNEPTDQWLASILTGYVFDGDVPIFAGAVRPDRTVQEHIAALRDAIAKLAKDNAITLAIVGFKDFQRHSISFSATIGPGSSYRGAFTPRKRGRDFQLFAVGAVPPKHLTDQAIARMMDGNTFATTDPERILSVLTDVIRATAQCVPTVGPDVMQIMRCRIVDQDCRFYRFVPATPGVWSYSPWIIGAGMVCGPNRTNLAGWVLGPGFPVEDLSERPEVAPTGVFAVPLERRLPPGIRMPKKP